MMGDILSELGITSVAETKIKAIQESQATSKASVKAAGLDDLVTSVGKAGSGLIDSTGKAATGLVKGVFGGLTGLMKGPLIICFICCMIILLSCCYAAFQSSE
jgi:hypothetical protein